MTNINDKIEQIRNAETIVDVWALEDMLDADIRDQAESNNYPHFGYTTAQEFESAEAWETWKRHELAEAVSEAKARLAE